MTEQMVPSVAATALEQCLLCGSREFDDIHVTNGCIMRECRECGLCVNASFDPGPGGMEEHYGPEYHERWYGRKGRRRRRSAGFLARHLSALRRPGRLLDIGSSEGLFLEAAQARGWEACGIDLNAEVVETCRGRGLRVDMGELGAIPHPDETFDVVNARHVLEHDIEVYRSLAEIRRVLKPGGLLLAEVPNAASPKVRRRRGTYAGFWMPDHMVCFTRPTLARLMRWAGLEPVSTFAPRTLLNEGPAGVLPYGVWRAAKLVKEWVGLETVIRGAWRKIAGPGTGHLPAGPADRGDARPTGVDVP